MRCCIISARLSGVGGDVRPGHRASAGQATSGAIVVAKDDVTHRKLGEMFSERQITKRYIALVHGWVAKDDVTVNLPIARDARAADANDHPPGGRPHRGLACARASSGCRHRFGKFSLVEVSIETGRTHQIRVHMQALGYAVVGDTLYGAPARIRLTPPSPAAPSPTAPTGAADEALELNRNFLHAAHLEFAHPRTGIPVSVDVPLPRELQAFLVRLTDGPGRS